MSRELQHSHPGTYRRVSVDADGESPARRGPARRGQISGTKGTPQAESPSAATIIRNMGAGFMRTVLACAPAVCPGSLRRSLAAPGLRCKATRQRPLPRRHRLASARTRVKKISHWQNPYGPPRVGRLCTNVATRAGSRPIGRIRAAKPAQPRCAAAREFL